MDQEDKQKKAGRTGRPVDTRKTAEIREAARKLFFEHGVEAVTIEQIASEAGVAKTTVYSKFGSKEAVFQAVIDDIGTKVGSSMKAEIAAGSEPREALIAFGISLLSNMAERRLLTAEPVIAMEAIRNPELGQKFFEMGPGRARAMVAAGLAEWISQGLLPEGNPTDMAEDLLGLWLGTLVYEMRLKPAMVVKQAHIEKRAKDGVDKFLRIYH